MVKPVRAVKLSFEPVSRLAVFVPTASLLFEVVPAILANKLPPLATLKFFVVKNPVPVPESPRRVPPLCTEVAPPSFPVPPSVPPETVIAPLAVD